MSARKLTPLALFLAAALAAVIGLTGGPYAGAATEPSAAKTKPADPDERKGVPPLDQYGPSEKDNAALRWSEQTLKMIRTASPPLAPTVVSRVLAVVQTSVYDAWAAYDPKADGTALGEEFRQDANERTPPNKSKAVSFAAHGALLDLFPDRAADIDEFLVEDLGYDVKDESAPARIGRAAAAAVVAARKNDGANQSGKYSDWTKPAYEPVNKWNEVVDKWRWQPLKVTKDDGTTVIQRFATPHWGEVRPFALTRADQFTVPAPDRRKDYRKAVHDVVKFSAHLTDTDKMIAEYWADGPSTELPPGHNAIFAAALCRMSGNNIDNDVKMLFLQANAVLDAGIAAWHYKRKYDFVRPITLVRTQLKGQKIRAWVRNQGTQTIKGEDWLPYQPADVVTPPFAEYVSGHSTFSAASFAVLRSFTGSDRLGLSVTIKAGDSRIEKGRTPAKDVTLTWRTMQDAADQAGISREYGGIHFREGDLHGRTLGSRIGAAVFAKAQTYFNGTAAGE
jgi:hypothetical protein